MTKRTNSYTELSADYSKPGLVSNELVVKLLQDAETYIFLREETFLLSLRVVVMTSGYPKAKPKKSAWADRAFSDIKEYP